jgi:diguanylate cyclase (GGDEF)-like protein/PAS domain S-box-containing protein
MIRSAIICVDDEWNILRSLGEQLRRSFGEDYDIELVNYGEDALSLCEELTAEGINIPLIISDQNMQGMKGDALLIQLHTLYPKTLKIMLTGQADVDSVGNVVNAASLYRYIRKPWDETDLIITITEALRRFQQEQQLVEQHELLMRTNAKLESSLSLLLSTLEATADGILALDRSGGVISFNRKFTSIWNLSDSSLTDREDNLLDAIMECLTESDAINFQALLAQINTEKHDFLRLKNDNIVEYYLQPHQLDGEIVGGVLSFRDVTQEKQAEAIMKHQAFYDALTNLPNRILFDRKMAAVLNDVTNDPKLVALMFLDLDRFKDVNDTLGHSVGDLLLQSVVQRLVGCLREVDLLARWGGDEFVILLPQIRNREGLGEVAQRLIEVLQPQFCLEGNYLDVTVSIGIAIYPHDALDSNRLLQNADSALYRAKKCGRNNFQFYSDDLTISNSTPD